MNKLKRQKTGKNIQETAGDNEQIKKKTSVGEI